MVATTDIRLRPARLDELEALTALCLRSKAVWGYDAAFMAACRSELTLTAADLTNTHIHVAEGAGGVLGLVSVSVEGDCAILEKLFVEPRQLRGGVGRLLLQWAVETARQYGAGRIEIDADPDAAGFYERMGARQAGTVPSASIPGRMLPRLTLTL